VIEISILLHAAIKLASLQLGHSRLFHRFAYLLY